MKQGLVSVIVPVYRADRFIEGALDSVGRQRYAEWEVVVVEDKLGVTMTEIVKSDRS